MWKGWELQLNAHQTIRATVWKIELIQAYWLEVECNIKIDENSIIPGIMFPNNYTMSKIIQAETTI